MRHRPSEPARDERTGPRFRTALVAVAFILTSAPVVFRDNPGAFSIAMSGFAVVVLFATKWRLKVGVAMIAFVVWAALSSLWTFDPAGTANELLPLIAAVTIGFAVTTFGSQIIVRGLLLGSVSAVVASLALGALSPRYGRSVEFGGAFTGIYAHRNFLASVSVICLALCIAQFVTARDAKERTKLAVLIAVASAAIVSTLSSSAIVIAIVLVLGGAVIWFFRKIGPLGRLGLIPIVAVVIAGFVVPAIARAIPDLTAAVGRDATFTGRSEIWDVVNIMSARQPTLGYGWGGVWDGQVGGFIRSVFGYDSAKSAHNGFLDVLLQLGWIGAILGAVVAVGALIRSARLALASAEHAWMLLVLLAVFVNSFSESQLTRPLGTFLVATIAACSIVELRRLREGTERPREARTGYRTSPTAAVR